MVDLARPGCCRVRSAGLSKLRRIGCDCTWICDLFEVFRPDARACAVTFKRETYEMLHALAAGSDPSDAYHEDARFWASHPWNEMEGLDAIRGLWSELRASFPDLERRDLIFLAGHSKEDKRVDPSFTDRPMVAALGHIQATFAADFKGIPATKGVVMLRVCEAHHVVNGKIAHTYMMIDLLDLMEQAGVWPLMPMLGGKGIWPGPASNDGVRPEIMDHRRGDAVFQTVVDMHNALLSFDGKTLGSMDHSAFWTERFMYYGGAGIGACRGLQGFRAHHQIPFLKAFPDRTGAGHYIRIGDGDYAVTAGWPSVRATHQGAFLGMTPTGRRIDVRVMDFYHFEGGRISENWLPIDIPHMAHQMGFDVFERLAHMRGRPRLTLS